MPFRADHHLALARGADGSFIVSITTFI